MIHVDVHMGITIGLQRLWVIPKIGKWLQELISAFLFLGLHTYWLEYSC